MPVLSGTGIFLKITSMKKYIIAAALAAFAAVSCSNTSVEERREAFKNEIQQFMETYNQSMTAIQEDESLTAEQKAEKAESVSEDAEKQYKDICLTAIKKNKDNDIALDALQSVFYMLETSELENTIASLSDSLQHTELVEKISAAIKSKKATEEGKMFTDFTIVQDPENPAASTVKFSDYAGKGKYLLVDFWASWCGPCKAEIPNIIAVYEKYAGEKFDVLSIAVWDEPAKTAAAAREEGVVWNQIVNAREIPTDIYGIEGIPHIMLLGPDGTILKRNLRGADIEAEVSKYIQAK